jgi:hypothetical protein
MVLPIYVYGADVLRETAKEIDFASYEGLQELIANMQETMEKADGVGIAAIVGAGVQLGDSIESLGSNGMSVGSVSTLIGIDIYLTSHYSSVGANPRNNVEPFCMTDAVGNKGILTGNV